MHVKREREQKNSIKEEIRVQGLSEPNQRGREECNQNKDAKNEHGGWQHSGTGWQKGKKNKNMAIKCDSLRMDR